LDRRRYGIRAANGGGAMDGTAEGERQDREVHLVNHDGWRRQNTTGLRHLSLGPVPPPTMHDLDTHASYDAFDTARMHERIAGLAQQCEQAYQAAQTIALPDSYGTARHIVLAGM